METAASGPDVLPPHSGEPAFLAVLVNTQSDILGGMMPDTAEVRRLSEVLRPYSGIAFDDWWAGLLKRAAQESEARTVALIQIAESEACPVSVSLSRIPNREEYLVACYRVGYRQLALLNSLHSLGLAISRLDLDGVLRTVRENIVALVPLDSFFVVLYDRETGLLHLREVIDEGAPVPDITQALGDGLVGWAISRRESVRIGDLLRDEPPVPYLRYGTISRAVVIEPLTVKDEVVGALSVQSSKPDVYTDEDLWLLEAVAAQTAVAIYNAHLYEQTAMRLATLASLQSVFLRLTTVFGQSQIAEVLSDAISELLHPDEVRLYLRPGAVGSLQFANGRTAEGPIFECPEPEPDGVIALVDEQGSSFVLNQAGDHPRVRKDFNWPPASVAAYPIRRSGQRFGVLALAYREAHFFRQDERRMLNLLGQQAAIVLENTYYRDNLLQQFEEVSALYSLAQQITGRLASEEILPLVARVLRDTFHCRACVITLRDEANPDELVIQAAVGVKEHWQKSVRWKVGEGIAGQVVATGRSVYVPDVHARVDSPIFDPDVHSVIAVPIAFQNHVLGSLNLDSQRPAAFTANHEHILTIAAAQVAATLENARLYQAEADRARKLAEANEELRTVEQLREELIQNLSHELRTPLTYIKGYASLLQDGELGTVQAEQQDALRIISDKADAIQRLITDVVTLEQIDENTLELEDLELNAFVEEALASARLMHGEKQISFNMELAPEKAWVRADRRRLGQAVDNLLANAAKFTPEGGSVTVRTQTSDGGHEAILSVSDTGIGIAPEYLERVFQRFYQIKDPDQPGTGGSGIGLAIVRRVVEAHQGHVTVASEKGKGSTFTLVLPRLENPPA